MSYIGAAANVVGGAMQAIAASMENAAMQQAFNQEMRQQLGLSSQAYGQWMAGLPGQSEASAENSINAGAKKAQTLYGGINSTPLLANGGDTSPYASTDRAAIQQSGVASSKLSGLSDWGINKMINDIKTNDAINRINFRSQGLASLFPYKMYNAQHSQDELNFWGKAISSIGGGGAPLNTDSPPPSMAEMKGASNPTLLDGGTGQAPYFDPSLYKTGGTGIGGTMIMPSTGFV